MQKIGSCVLKVLLDSHHEMNKLQLALHLLKKLVEDM